MKQILIRYVELRCPIPMEQFTRYLKRNGLTQKEYQEKGIEWCKEIEQKGVLINGHLVHSGILADEMGLGKTIQMIGIMLENFKLHNLIVLPKVLLQQWQNIIYTTLGHKPLIFHGASTKHITMYKLYTAPIVLTTYGMLSQIIGKKVHVNKNIPVKYNLLHEMVWDRIIFDEAHHLRNRKTSIHTAALHIKATHKWLVTGTPIQNSITDMYGLCSILGISQSFYNKREHLSIIVDNIILKRTKKQVGINMPALTHNNITVKWENNTEKQIAHDIHEHLHFNKNNPLCDTNMFFNMSLHPFALMQRSQQSCVSMKMLSNTMCGVKDIHYQSKLNRVLKMIQDRKDNGSAKLVFCYYHMEMDTIVKTLSDCGMRVAKINGRTRQTARTELMHAELDVLVLQIKTGCEGLNLQHFNEVYFVSPHWNPAMEDQAVARSHRIGQDKPVQVFSFNMELFDDGLCKETMDTYIQSTQHYKRGLYLD